MSFMSCPSHLGADHPNSPLKSGKHETCHESMIFFCVGGAFWLVVFPVWWCWKSFIFPYVFVFWCFKGFPNGHHRIPYHGDFFFVGVFFWVWEPNLLLKMYQIPINTPLPSARWSASKGDLNFTLQGTNISPTKALLKMIFLFARWDMLIPWRVSPKQFVGLVTFKPTTPLDQTGPRGFPTPPISRSHRRGQDVFVFTQAEPAGLLKNTKSLGHSVGWWDDVWLPKLCYIRACDRADQLPLFPYNRGMGNSTQMIGVYIPIIRFSYERWDEFIPKIGSWERPVGTHVEDMRVVGQIWIFDRDVWMVDWLVGWINRVSNRMNGLGVSLQFCWWVAGMQIYRNRTKHRRVAARFRYDRWALLKSPKMCVSFCWWFRNPANHLGWC